MKILISSLAFIIGSSAWGQATNSVLVQSKTQPVEIELNTDTVKCLIGDYGVSSLKVLIPELANMTLLNHRVPGSNAPCVTAGFCKGLVPGEELDVSMILGEDRPPTEVIYVTIDLMRDSQWIEATQTCEVFMTEVVTTQIRGLEFKHTRAAELSKGQQWFDPQRPKEDCI